MAHWLYRYVFRGIGILFLAGIITGLFLFISQVRRSADHPAAPAAPNRHAPVKE